MTQSSDSATDAEMREFVETLLRFETVTDRVGAEEDAQEWLVGRLAEMGFETYEWLADADQLAAHPTFPDDPAEITVTDRPSVGGVYEFGDPDAGPTLLLNGHVDVVSVEPELWDSDPFEPTWSDDGTTLTARGAADMKGGLAACVFAARRLADAGGDLDGRVVVESVAGEEDGGIGSAAAALSNPYPCERDAAIVAEPTDRRLVTAMEGTLFLELTITGESAHAGSRWEGESVLPHFERIRHAFEDLEAERSERVRNPLYEDYPIAWPVNFGVVEAGNWPSSVPASLTARIRIGVAPRETHAEVEAEFRDALDEVVAGSEWLSAHPPALERFAANFPSGETDADEPVVEAVQAAMAANGFDDTAPRGAVYGADAARYIDMAGIPSVLFGPGSGEQAHKPNEYVRWPEVELAVDVLADAGRELLG